MGFCAAANRAPRLRLWRTGDGEAEGALGSGGRPKIEDYIGAALTLQRLALSVMNSVHVSV